MDAGAKAAKKAQLAEGLPPGWTVVVTDRGDAMYCPTYCLRPGHKTFEMQRARPSIAEGVPPGVPLSGGKVRPPYDKDGVTAEWLTAALHERGHLPKAVKVANLEPLVNIGEGRGYANYSWKLVATYDKPVSPDVPRKFVLKQLNQSFAPGSWGEGIGRILSDRSYRLECTWYEEIRDRLPIPQPKLFWSGAESPSNPGALVLRRCDLCACLRSCCLVRAASAAKDFGVYGVLMEWLGDDLKLVHTADGISEEETIQAMQAIAKLHAAWWNTPEPEALKDLFTPEESLQMIREFMGGAEVAASYAETDLTAALGEKFGAFVTTAVRTMEDWDFKGCTNNKVLCSWDLRTENMVWRRSPSGPQDYECVIIDHQVWSYGGAPTYDLAIFFGCSCTEEQMGPRVEVGLRTYHETLLAEGVTTYSFDELNRDFDRATWHATTIPCFGGKMLKGVRETAAAATSGSPAETEALAMQDNLTKLFTSMAARTKSLVELRNAYSCAPFVVPGY